MSISCRLESSESKSLRIANTFLNISADLDIAVVWLLSVLSSISKYSVASCVFKTVPGLTFIIDAHLNWIFQIFFHFLSFYVLQSLNHYNNLNKQRDFWIL